MTTMVIVALLVLFGAALVGKILMNFFPDPIFGTTGETEVDDRTPAE